jgi:hypothetical protein
LWDQFLTDKILKLKSNSGYKQSTFRNGQCYGGQSSHKAMDAYAITTDKGNIDLKPNSTYVIKLSYLGMQNKEITVVTKAENDAKHHHGIWRNELDGVEIVREMPFL